MVKEFMTESYSSRVVFSKNILSTPVQNPQLPTLFLQHFHYSSLYYSDMPMQSRLALPATSKSNELIPFTAVCKDNDTHTEFDE